MATFRSAGYAAFLLAALALVAPPVSASDTAVDEARVMETMRVMFTAMADDDMARYRQVTTPDFYAFDIGRNMTSDQLIDVVEEARESGMTFYWQVTEQRVNIDGKTARSTYVNRGSFRIGADPRDVVWLEAAVVRTTGVDMGGRR